MSPLVLSRISSAALLALIVLCVLWEGWLAPLRPGGSWLILKAVPLLPAVFGVLRGRRYTSQWLSMLSLLYFTEGVLRAGDPGLIGVFALVVGATMLTLIALARQSVRGHRAAAPRPADELAAPVAAPAATAMGDD